MRLIYVYQCIHMSLLACLLACMQLICKATDAAYNVQKKQKQEVVAEVLEVTEVTE